MSIQPRVSKHACLLVRVGIDDILVLFVCNLVFRTIQEKLNNPSPDDPFDPEIAAVCILLFHYGNVYN